MKKILLVLVILAALAAIAFGDRMKAGQVLVKFRVQNSGSNARVHRAVGGRVIDRFPQIGVELVQLRSGVSVSQAVTRYRRYAAVLYAGPNYYRELLFRPNDPSYSQQYHPRRVFAEEGWDLTRGDSGTVIAVLDTGQDLSHPDLHDKLLPGYDFSDNDSDPSDYQGHGTHTAGIAAADTNNGIGVAGIGFDCKIMPLKIFPEATVSNVIRAVLYATDNGANVLSMSFGGAPPSQAEEDSYTYALANDVLPIASAGNGNSNTKYFGEYYMTKLALAKNAVVMLNRLCYASGNSEWGSSNPTRSTAIKRVDNYGAGFLRSGARAVFASGITGMGYVLKGLFRGSKAMTMKQLFWTDPSRTLSYRFAFTSVRTPGASAQMDPYKPSRYYRSVIGWLGITIGDWRAG